MSLLAHRPLSCEPPPGRSKLRGAGLCAARSEGVRGTAPSAYLATCMPCHLLWRRSIWWSVETCPREAEVREGGECAIIWFDCSLSNLHLRPTSLLAHRPLSCKPPSGR